MLIAFCSLDLNQILYSISPKAWKLGKYNFLSSTGHRLTVMKLGHLGPDSVPWASCDGELGSPSSLSSDTKGEPGPAKAETVLRAPEGAPGRQQGPRLPCSE